MNISSDHSQISFFSGSFLITFSQTEEHLQSDIIYSPTSGASTRRPRLPLPYGPDYVNKSFTNPGNNDRLAYFLWRSLSLLMVLMKIRGGKGEGLGKKWMVRERFNEDSEKSKDFLRKK